ncbi:MAG: long-chain fatty acid--CoA ligase [bacterium]|nr:long-chain fatty acid--CoA ligase [bacterium]
MPDTIAKMFFNIAEKFSDKVALRHRENTDFRDITYREYSGNVRVMAAGLDELGLEKNDKIAFISENRPEWAYIDLGAQTLGAVTVPVYPTLAPNCIEVILNDCQAKILAISQPEHLEIIRKIFNNLKYLKTIITFFECENDLKVLHTLEDVMKKGSIVLDDKKEKIDSILKSQSPDDLVTIIYTSGTTGDPKGAMLTNSNIMSNIDYGLQMVHVSESDEMLSWLPMSHVLERVIGYYLPLYVGATVSYAESPKTISDDIKEVKPTIVVCVPRLFEKIYYAVQENVAKGGFHKKLIFQWCVRTGKKYYNQKKKNKISKYLEFRYRLADKLVFSKLKKKTGGRIRLFISGGAPLSVKINEFFNYAGLTLVEGYGLTETSPILTINPPDENKFGTVGKPMPETIIKIAEDGEILAKGPQIMQGYYNDPKGTAEAIDEEGWFHTGDIGELDEENYLKITDRKKNIIVTSGGKNIAPQFVENILMASRYIEQIMMIGDNKPFPSALVVPSFENVEYYFKTNSISFKSLKEMLRDPRTYELIEGEVDRLSVDLPRFMKVKKVLILDREFNQENGEITPTLKIKRNVVEQIFSKEIKNIYSSDENIDKCC